MPLITLITANGTRHELQAAAGPTLMQLAVGASLGDIVGECGGAAMCATCHVYVDDAWLPHMPPMQESEDAMLDATVADRQPNSRLSCQLHLQDDWNGLTVLLPAQQV